MIIQAWLGQNLSSRTNLTYLIWTMGVLSLRLNQSSRSREWLAAGNAMEKNVSNQQNTNTGDQWPWHARDPRDQD